MNKLGASIVGLAFGMGVFLTAVACDRTVSTLAGGASGGVDGTGSLAGFSGPLGVTVAGDGNIYVVDSSGGAVRKVTPSGVVTTVATGIFSPTRVAVDSSGNLYVTQSNGSAISKITPSGTVSIFASGLSAPFGIAIDKFDNVYVTVSGTAIKKITQSGVVSVVAGSEGNSGYANGSGAAARFNGLNDISFEPSGALVATDTGNRVIRRITLSGVVSLVAGVPGSYGLANGPAASATFSNLWGIAADPLGNIYVTDISNNTIREVSYQGVVSTLAGVAYSTGAVDGPASTATFASPMGIASDSHGVLYVTNTQTSTLRKIE